MDKKLYKSKENKVIAGVLGGLAEHFHVDATLLRLAYAFIVIFTAIVPGIILYVIAALIVPEKPETHSAASHQTPPASGTTA